MSNEDKTLLETINQELIEKESLFSVVVLSDDNIISTYEISTKLNNIYDYDISAFLPNGSPVSLESFFDITSDIISKAQDNNGVLDSEKVVLTEEYPPDEFHNFGNEVIAYRVIKREPALMDKKGTGRPQRSFSHNYQLNKANYPNKLVIVEARPVDHIIEFACWAKTNKVANKRAIWLEKLLINNTWRYQTKGVERFYWEGRGADTYMTTGEQRLFYRPLRFFVRFREFEAKLNSLIKNIEIIHGGIKNG